jgi:hypothetical protein
MEQSNAHADEHGVPPMPQVPPHAEPSRASRATPAINALPWATKLAAAAGLVLVVAMLMTWLRADVPLVGKALSGFQVAPYTFALLLTIAGAAAVVAYGLLGRPVPGPIAPAHLLVAPAALGIAAIVKLIVDPPQLLPGGDMVNQVATLAGAGAKPGTGMYLGALALLAIVVAGLASPGGPLTEGGRLRAALLYARDTGHKPSLVAIGCGAAAPVVALFGLMANSAVLVMLALCLAIAAIAVARLARTSASGGDLTYLSRYGQIIGWTMLAVVVVVLVVLLLALGQTAGRINDITEGWSNTR